MTVNINVDTSDGVTVRSDVSVVEVGDYGAFSSVASEAALAAQQAAADAISAKEAIEATTQINIVNFLEGVTDQQAFQAAIDSLPSNTTFEPDLGTLNDNELPTYEIIVPIKPTGLSTNTERWYVLTDHVRIGRRDIIWRVDSGARFGALNNSMGLLSGRVLMGGNIHVIGFSNKNKRTNLALTQGSAALSYAGSKALISAYDPDTVDTQAYQHERGASNIYNSISDNTEIKVPGAGTTYTSNRVFFDPPLDEATSDLLRIGMAVDTIGNMSVGSPVRHTSRIVSFSLGTGGVCTDLIVENWRRMVASPPFTSSVESVPANGTALVINPVNKLWHTNANLFLNKTDGATYGYTSGSTYEGGIFNNTGQRAGTEFDRDTHPFHIWAMDMPHLGAHGGGIAYIVRGQQTWDRAFENRSAEIGFHNHGTQFNNGKLAFVSSSGFDGAFSGWGTGTPAYDFLARTRVGGVWDNQFGVVGGSPTVEIGRKGSTSTPRIRFYADGLAGSNTALWDAEIATTSTNGGTLILDAKHDTLMRWNGADRLRVTSTGVSIAGLLTGGAVTQSSTDATAGRLLKVGDFGIGASTAPGSTDLNTITQTGVYSADSATANRPGGTGNWLVIHMARTSALTVQLAVSRNGTDGMYQRSQTSAGVWSAWREFYHTDNLPVTQSNVDTTAGRLLKVGDFGLGGQALNVSDFNDAGQHNRMIFGTDSVTNAPFIWPVGWQFTRADNRRTQFVLSSIAGVEKAAFRNEGSGGFGAWREFYHTGNLSITQSPTDTTAGRLTKVGDFGIGGLVPLVGNISVTNNTIAPGFYRYSTVEGSTGGPTGVLEGHLWHSRRTNGGGETQLLIAESVSSGSASVVWLRVRGSGAWSPWRMSYGQGNTVGTVSQSGGVPTGAVIESGTGPNGTYVKFADGTVMCWIDNIIEQNLAADTYVEVTWTLPVVMLTSPMYHVGTTVHSFNDAAGRENALRWLKSSGVAVGGTAPVISCYNSKTSTVAVRVDAFAIGRWF